MTFAMSSNKLSLYFLYSIGLIGQLSSGYHFRGYEGVIGNPISNYPSPPQIYTVPTFGGFHQNFGSRPLHSISRHADTNNVNRPRQDSPINYHIISYENNGVRSESFYSNFKISLNQGLDKNVKTKSAINNDHVYNNSLQRPITAQNSFNPGNVFINEPVTVGGIQKQQHFPISDEQMYNYSTTEPAAILGKPLILPTSVINAGKKDLNTRSKNKAQKQCVQDCQSSTSYRPICGTDKVTYFNEDKFLCAKKCGIDVSILKRGACT